MRISSQKCLIERMRILQELYKHIINTSMKKITITLITTLIALTSFAQAEQKSSVVQKDSLIDAILQRLENIEYKTERVARYKLYKTENIYNLLKLDTATGKIEQLQWSLDDEKEGTMTINSEDLSLLDKQPGVFELYPTNNMYQFILLDKVIGRTWHVQWGFGSGKRWIKRIY